MGLFNRVKDEHNHENHENCGCGHDRNQDHENCGCGHEHNHDDSCGCSHEHKKHNDCGCEHERNHEDSCGCGHNHDHGHSHGGCDCEEVDVRRTAAGVVMFLIVTVVFHIPGLFKSIDAYTLDTIELIVYLLIYLLTAKEIVVNAIKNVFKGKALDEQFLMTIASLGAFFVGEYSEACAVMLFYLVGEAFQDYAVDKSRASITELMDIRPDYANIVNKDGTTEKVEPGKVKVGDLIMVKPGEKVPLDGIVAGGESSLDTSALTGESLPREVVTNDLIISGSINLSGAITVKVTKTFGESTVSKILDLVENASAKKAKTEKFITRFAKVYTPIVVALAFALAIIPPVFNSVVLGADIGDFYGVWNEWIYRALTFLVISCPCALVISVPLSFFAGIGAASTKGVLIKGSNYLEAMSECDTIVFDKTGTLTQGVFKVNKIQSNVSEEEFLKTAVIAEIFSSHPIAKSLKDCLSHLNKELLQEIEKNQNNIKVQEIHGKGIKALYEGSEILAGNAKLMRAENVEFEETDELGTVVYVSKDGVYLGYALIADQIKETSKETISTLKKLGIKKTVMLTGDKKEIAESIGKEIGIDEVHAELLPGDKVEHIEQLLKESKKLAFVGDGINDAPVLARADVGIAMGAMGSDAAIEAADLVLMDDNPLSIAKSIKLSRKTIGIAKQNIVFALAVKVLVLALAAVGVASMWAAVFADVGVCVIAIFNAMRCSK